MEPKAATRESMQRRSGDTDASWFGTRMHAAERGGPGREESAGEAASVSGATKSYDETSPLLPS